LNSISRVETITLSSPTFSSSNFSSSSFSIKIPSLKPSTSWERGANAVKNVDTTNKYLEHIRDVHDPSLHLKTLEDELRGTMGQALGKQGEKILNSLRCLEEERSKYVELLSSHSDCNGNDSKDTINTVNGDGFVEQEENKIKNISFLSMSTSTQAKLIHIIKTYNKHRNDAQKSRWELTVHRQAVGFIVNNHKFVQDKFPIPPPLDLPFDFDVALIHSNANKNSLTVKKGKEGEETVTRNFGTQTDWWDNIGRWR